MLKQKISNIFRKPKNLFLIDGAGALLSFIMLGIVLVNMEWLFGVPKDKLFILAAFPLFFSVLDISFYQVKHAYTPLLLRIIAILNILYCFLSIGIALTDENITYFGWLYILIEVLIILFLAIIEWLVAEKQSSLKDHPFA